jgi:hypothetical protein
VAQLAFRINPLKVDGFVEAVFSDHIDKFFSPGDGLAHNVVKAHRCGNPASLGSIADDNPY